MGSEIKTLEKEIVDEGYNDNDEGIFDMSENVFDEKSDEDNNHKKDFGIEDDINLSKKDRVANFVDSKKKLLKKNSIKMNHVITRRRCKDVTKYLRTKLQIFASMIS